MTAEPETVAVRAWQALAAMPSTRAIGKCAGVSHVTVADALNGTRVPSWKVLEKIAVCLGEIPANCAACGLMR